MRTILRIRSYFVASIFLLVVACLLSAKSMVSFHEQLNVTYIIKNVEQVKDAEKYISAMNTADFTSYRLRDTRQVLKFKTGVEVELFSARELQQNGIVGIQPGDYPEKWPSDKVFGQFSLGPNNYIMEERPAILPKH